MKHAYLIMAHNEPEVLKSLLNSLDDYRNDIYLHIDSKASFDGSEYSTKNAGLYILSQRINAYWGDISLVAVEYLLFEASYFKLEEYSYYHLISGVDIPIKSQDYIHEFCELYKGYEFIGFVPDVYAKDELRWKVGIYHFFPHYFRSSSFVNKSVRFILTSAQKLLGIHRNKGIVFKKGCQWCSLTNSFVSYLLEHKSEVMSIYKHTFCPDEIFIPTLCWNSVFRTNVFDLQNGYISCKRHVNWKDGKLMPITEEDVDSIISKDSWFARKFSSENMSVINMILTYLR